MSQCAIPYPYFAAYLYDSMKSFEMIDFINRNVFPMTIGKIAYRILRCEFYPENTQMELDSSEKFTSFKLLLFYPLFTILYLTPSQQLYNLRFEVIPRLFLQIALTAILQS